MDLNQSPKSPALALHMAQQLARVSQAGGKVQIDAQLQQDTGQSVMSHHAAATENLPAWYAASSGTWSVLLIAGCSNLNHATQTINGYRGALLGPIDPPTHLYFRQCASAIYGVADGLSLLGRENVFLCGHSLGGAICENLVGTFRPLKTDDKVTLLTFGAPRAGGEDVQTASLVPRRARWFCTDDPVPLLPPRPTDWPSVVLSYNLAELSRFVRFVHQGPGLQINVDSTIQSGVLPEAASINATGSLIGWMLAVDGSSSSAHHLTTYQSRLGYWMLQNPGVPVPPATPNVAEEPANTNRRILTEQQQDVVQQVQVLSSEQNGFPVNIPPQLGFRYSRLGRLWVVTLGEEVITMTAVKRTARTTAREGNEFLRNLQRQGIVNRDALREQFAAYLAKAGEAGSGITPVMKTQLPTA